VISRPRIVAALAAVAAAAAMATVAQSISASAAGASTPRGTQHVIVRSTTADLARLRHLVRSVGGRVDRTLGLIHAVSATIPAASLAALRADRTVADVTRDARVRLAGARGASGPADPAYAPSTDSDSMYKLETIVGARNDWKAGYTGRGIDVALVDSGVAQVPGLLPGNVVLGPDLTEESQDPSTAGVDTFGHGTHLAGIIAGHDASVTNTAGAATNSTDFLGMAPDARIVSVKVADAHGVSDVSQVIAGIDWVVQHAHDPGMNIRVMNLSFGTDSTQAYTVDPLAYAAEQAWQHGIVVVTSAGNSGTSAGQLTDPAIDPFVIAVGADDPNGTAPTTDDSIAAFSSVGDGTRNPDLVAPGVHVQSLRDPGSYIDQTFAGTGAINARFFRGSGTSQAAAMVSGAAALLLQQQPNLTPDQVKVLLTQNAAAIPNTTDAAAGAGLLHLKTSYGPVPPGAQNFTPSTGTGKLELSRGTDHIAITDTATGVTTDLTGEQDIFGHAVNTFALANLEAGATAWNGGTFNGNAWTGSGWTTSDWASSSWRSSSWRASSWTSSSWASSSWRTDDWSSSTWKGDGWSGSTWAASYWR
jgi:serine protease AprX